MDVKFIEQILNRSSINNGITSFFYYFIVPFLLCKGFYCLHNFKNRVINGIGNINYFISKKLLLNDVVADSYRIIEVNYIPVSIPPQLKEDARLNMLYKKVEDRIWVVCFANKIRNPEYPVVSMLFLYHSFHVKLMHNIA